MDTGQILLNGLHVRKFNAENACELGIQERTREGGEE